MFQTDKPLGQEESVTIQPPIKAGLVDPVIPSDLDYAKRLFRFIDFFDILICFCSAHTKDILYFCYAVDLCFHFSPPHFLLTARPSTIQRTECRESSVRPEPPDKDPKRIKSLCPFPKNPFFLLSHVVNSRYSDTCYFSITLWKKDSWGIFCTFPNHFSFFSFIPQTRIFWPFLLQSLLSDHLSSLPKFRIQLHQIFHQKIGQKSSLEITVNTHLFSP